MCIPKLEDSRHPLAIQYNELANRIEDCKEMQEAIIEQWEKDKDHLAAFLGGHDIEKEIEKLKQEMKSIRKLWYETEGVFL